jgi:alkylation response protein AidB-like acyl-CoA dehydrogenase
MNFDLTPDQRLLLETVASFVRKESPVSRARKLRDDALGFERKTWKQMGDLGWLGVLYPESAGGFGGSFVDAAIVLEHLGTQLVPEPYLASVILGGMALCLAGSEEQQGRFLAPAIAGDASLALAYAERGGRYDTAWCEARAERAADGYRLHGQKVFVLNGHAAEHIVVVARTGGEAGDREGISLFVVDGPGADGALATRAADTGGAAGGAVRARGIQLLDGRRGAVVTLDGAAVGRDRLLGDEGGALPVLERLMDLGAAAACAEGVGIIRSVLDMTLDYLRTREQFGAKIGSFQALQHRAVDMFIESELAKSTSIMASIKVGDADAVERMTAISAAKAQLAQSGRLVTQQGIQLHGGIGITDEHDIGLYFKRMQVLLSLFGDEDHHVARFARLPTFLGGLAADDAALGRAAAG